LYLDIIINLSKHTVPGRPGPPKAKASPLMYVVVYKYVLMSTAANRDNRAISDQTHGHAARLLKAFRPLML